MLEINVHAQGKTQNTRNASLAKKTQLVRSYSLQSFPQKTSGRKPKERQKPIHNVQQQPADGVNAMAKFFS